MNDKKYNTEGYLIVTEMESCPLWEKDTNPCRTGWNKDCFFCRFADFRTKDFIDKVESEPKDGVWFSVCHNEKNRRTESLKEDKNED